MTVIATILTASTYHKTALATASGRYLSAAIAPRFLSSSAFAFSTPRFPSNVVPPPILNIHARRHYRSRHAKTTFFASAESDDATNAAPKSLSVPGLKKETSRLLLRCQKKLIKANERRAKALHRWESSEEYLTCPDPSSLPLPEPVASVDETLAPLQRRLSSLFDLESALAALPGKSPALPSDVLALIEALEVTDAPPVRPPPGPKKPKGPRASASVRLPYRRFYAESGVEIRVGKSAEDNDVLSTAPEHRDSVDWWMHASGCPGSHVVIRTHGTPEKEVVEDAAALAASYSKFKGQRRVKVNLCRCREVSKPPGAKPGLVMIRGDVRTVTVDTKEAAARLKRLDETCLVN
uniref:NFACT RNA-binding domain-containing protein n=1 Tax=Corethron hystrix TaxID=216773 RepID=A0A7S1BVA7_9STRA